MTIEHDLQEFILRNNDPLSNEWMKLQEKKFTAYTSSTEDTSSERLNQNRMFNQIIAGIFVSDNVNFSAWSEQVAVKRANRDIPLHETLENFKNYRVVFWEWIMKFVRENEDAISLEVLGEWSRKVNSSFDHVIELFTIYFQQVSDARLQSQQQMIVELSAPIIPVYSKIGVLPLVGEIDTYRAQMIKESSLDKSTELKLEHLIIDLSGVPIMDTMVANELFQVVRALALLGIQTTVTGIRPEIAQTAVQLGIDFSNISTYAHLSQALPVIVKEQQLS
ncbi:STAS domain-containing protein [Fictibacillus fluitans]|uniref:STAS domain-containing protein n=1 Tax=Fictibacillus fluitans TaxID=3058422 RepID=A0ABT8HY11_9BACL|nr:STAS domain-containing protein [Fictibacillus sp. NE201]MDN4525663.1 STAS domain-containing protein [Fictibacillus sp. NE201]